ncbi:MULTISPECIES: T9SS type A sorting domain-containing protein [Aequorivita]|uniref:T9SS type A sorting domain-containing protein n=2 Tax=Aequorivita TaxID=153265 RepID=A0AB35YQW4_9FLAO|nr:T9SS type A sorting domain-containing protein [Aequorivita sp. Ant34-E75]WGF94059.1 T9SS type A sorting domain-containing protein [Aequorivita sp. Ant34-E75]
MKFKLLLLSVLGSVTMASAQFTVKDRSGNVLNDGDVIQFGVLDYPDASYEFFVTNDNPSDEIYTRIEYVSETNSTNGEFEQLCYGLCYNNIVQGGTVPPAGEDGLAIAVGETTPMGNHFWNDDPGNGTDNVDFVFAFRQYSDQAGTIETGTPLLFTYRYNPSMGVADNNKVNLTIQSTLVSNELVLNVNEPVTMVVYNIQGKIVKQGQFDAGRQVVNVSNLNPQTYIVQFSNQKGGVQTSKILVQ